MNRKWLLPIVSSSIAVLLGIGLLRLLAPGLLGAPAPIEIVQVEEKVVPFYENVFREERCHNRTGEVSFVKVPYLYQRMCPFADDLGKLGPTDLLGFRNRSVPAVADIITIGDSQTHGSNANVENNWPSQLARMLDRKRPVLYNMSVGGWGALEYLEIFRKARAFKPRVVVVAFYTGNDPLDSYTRAYARDRWQKMRDPSLTEPVSTPKLNYPPPEEEWWHVALENGEKTVFTPKLRYAANEDHPAVKAGYAVMLNAARQIVREAANEKVIFTIIPTKELAFAKRIELEEIEMNDDYKDLVTAEKANLSELAGALSGIKGAQYVDVLTPLQDAVVKSARTYPSSRDGHPMPKGYRVIANALLNDVDKRLPEPPNGLYVVRLSGRERQWVIVKGNEKWMTDSARLIEANGWSSKEAKKVPPRDLATIPFSTTALTANPDRFGPPVN
jgi:lysophospholipase L1-like esterase